jgi:hypothetical protein
MRILYLQSALLGVAIAASACVPAEDGEPTPGSVALDISVSPEARGAIALADGWTFTFDRVLAVIGRATSGYRIDSEEERVRANACGGSYGEGVLGDLLVGSSVTSNRLLRATCPVGIDLRGAYKYDGPDMARFSTQLGPGVTYGDLERLIAINKRLPHDDNFSYRTARALFEGRAAHSDGRMKRLELAVADSFVRYDMKCGSVDVEPGVRKRVPIVLSVERMFRDAREDAKPALRFEAFAQADEAGNRDGVVTEDELERVKLESLPHDGGTYPAPRPNGPSGFSYSDNPSSLREFAIQRLVHAWSGGEPNTPCTHSGKLSPTQLELPPE